MKTLLLFIVLCSSSLIYSPSLQALCARCEEANENNRRNPNPYVYYEEYVEAQSERNKEARSEGNEG